MTIVLIMKDDLPDYMKKMWEEARNHPKGKRARETEIVSEAFKKEGIHHLIHFGCNFDQIVL